ncbi:hypothetical protein Tco_1479109 [Tanacetum coccineum]
MKAITTRSGVAYEGPSIPTNPSPKKVVEQETEETTNKEQSNFQRSIAQIPPPVTPISILESNVPKTLPKPNIPYPSHALLLMPRFAPTIKSLLMNKDKLLELAKIPLNENCSAILLKKLPEKLGDPDKFTDEPALVCLTSPGDDDNEKDKKEVKNLAEPTAKRQTRITPCFKNFKVIQKESIFHLNKTPQVSSVFAITSILPTIEPENSLIIRDEHLSTFRVEEIVPIPRESEDTSGSDSKNVLPSMMISFP